MGELIDPKWDGVLCSVTFVYSRETSEQELRDNVHRHRIPPQLLEIMLAGAREAHKPLYIWCIGSVHVFDPQQREIAGMNEATGQTWCKNGLHTGYQLFRETGSMTQLRAARTTARADKKRKSAQRNADGAAKKRRCGNLGP